MSRNNFLKSVTVLDTETTSLIAEQAEIVEIAGGRYDGQNWQVKDTLLGANNGIPPEASAKTRISNRMIAGKPTFDKSLDVIDSILQPNNTSYYVAHNCQYDQTVLSESWGYARRTDLSKLALDKQRWICTYRLAKQLMEVNFTDMQYNLSYLRYKLDLPVDDDVQMHRAGDDTLVCAILFEFLVDYAIARELVTDNDTIGKQIHNLCWKPLVYTSWPFGKNKGRAFSEIPTDYYMWAISNIDALNENNPNFNFDLSESVRLELESRLEV